ncbi:uncharacterized protein B0H64DRAFT_209913 [Chaetomium fimeti]|uniref:Secreted protein n=1 Tax=Chaetomium fimeti TaxID=1854472 RepID=A0AAE0HBL2_9PEZI|nr:hypothetical protein B0H64DRAFT_209913 [Chaetomium fimeti]
MSTHCIILALVSFLASGRAKWSRYQWAKKQAYTASNGQRRRRAAFYEPQLHIFLSLFISLSFRMDPSERNGRYLTTSHFLLPILCPYLIYRPTVLACRQARHPDGLISGWVVRGKFLPLGLGVKAIRNLRCLGLADRGGHGDGMAMLSCIRWAIWICTRFCVSHL